MDEILSLKLELEGVRRAYWHSQQQLSQLLIERSLEIEKSLRAGMQSHSETADEKPSGLNGGRRSMSEYAQVDAAAAAA